MKCEIVYNGKGGFRFDHKEPLPIGQHFIHMGTRVKLIGPGMAGMPECENSDGSTFYAFPQELKPAPVVGAAIDDEILNRFLAPEHPVLKDILALWNLRGDLTQSGAERTRKELGDEAYEHYNWDTAASNGRVLIVVRRYKHPRGVKPPFGFHFPAEWFWCFSQIENNEDVEPAKPALIARVPEEVRASLSDLPALNPIEWIRIRRVNFFSHGSGAPKAKHRAAPEGVLFFRFPGGLGLAVAPSHSS